MALTYCGLLDDFSARHRDLSIVTLQELNNHLVAAVLIGEPLLINDGYILANLALRSAIVDAHSSPLRHLVETGYVKIHTRNQRKLNVLAEEMAAADITSAKNLTQGDWYKQTYKPALEEWCSHLDSEAYQAFVDWPNIRVDDIYKKVSETAYDSLRETINPKYADELTRFHDKLYGMKDRRRTEWEDEAKKLHERGQISEGIYRELMLAAAESYHYSWGCALGLSGNPAGVLTRLPRHLSYLDAVQGQPSGERRAAVELFLPDLAFAKRAIDQKWKLLAEIVLPAHPVNRLKADFLKALKAYYCSDSVSQREVEDTARDYGKALSKHFGRQERVSVTMDLCFVGAGAAAGLPGGPIGIAAGVAVGLVGVGAAHLGAPQLLWRLSAPNPKGWIKKQPPRAAPDGSASCFQLDSEEIRRQTADARPFK